MKVAIIINTSWNIYNFRLGLVNSLLQRGDSVLAIAPRDAYSQKLVNIGCEYEHLDMSASGMNPVTDFKLLFGLWKVLRKHRPDVVLTYTIKPNIYGSVASGLLKIPCICNVSGLGTVFLWKGYVKKIATRLYSFAFRFNSWIFFQNENDQEDFLEYISINPSKTGLLPGSGVDTSFFLPQKKLPPAQPIFLMIARLLVEKGIYDYIEAIRILKKKSVEAKFILMGSLDETHARSISKEELDTWIAEGLIEYLDHQEDIRSIVQGVDAVVLPSYREGTPKTLLEAGAMGKALIATDVPGCRQVVLNGENGFLCKLRDPIDLSGKIRLYMSLSVEEKQVMGEKARQSIVERYDQQLVIDQYHLKIEELVNPV